MQFCSHFVSFGTYCMCACICRPTLCWIRITCKPRGHSVQKTLWGHAANTGSKTSLLVLLMAPYFIQIFGNMNGSIFEIFQIWPKISSNLRKFQKKKKKGGGVILVKIWPEIELIGIYEWATFSLKIGKCMGPVSNYQQHVPTKTKLELKTHVDVSANLKSYTMQQLLLLCFSLGPELTLHVHLYVCVYIC